MLFKKKICTWTPKNCPCRYVKRTYKKFESCKLPVRTYFVLQVEIFYTCKGIS